MNLNDAEKIHRAMAGIRHRNIQNIGGSSRNPSQGDLPNWGWVDNPLLYKSLLQMILIPILIHHSSTDLHFKLIFAISFICVLFIKMGSFKS